MWTSDEALSTTELPARMLVVGGGAVGIELAFLFATFGTAVTLVHRHDRLLGVEEPEASAALQEILESIGVEVRLDEQVTAVKDAGPAGTGGLAVDLQNGDTVRVDRVVLATGRLPNSEDLGLENLGVTLDGSRVPDDDRCRVPGTSGVWAIGDVTGLAPYTHTAHYQGRVVAANLNGVDTRAHYATVPRAVYTTPALASVGHTRATAQAAGLSVVEARAEVSSTVRAVTEGARQGWLVLLADAQRGTLLGATAVGGRCEEWIPVVSTAIHHETPLEALVSIVRPFPTFGEVLEGCLWDLRDRFAP